MLETYLFESNYILFVYDITNRESFQKIGKMFSRVTELIDGSEVQFGLVGNKTDLFHQHIVKMQDHAQVYIYNNSIFN